MRQRSSLGDGTGARPVLDSPQTNWGGQQEDHIIAWTGFARGRAVWLLLFLGSFLQQPGLTTWDTKFDLTANPSGFLAGAMHLWNADLTFGELQNQAYGYLFPQGSFFLLTDLLHVPDWIAQRLWSALLLIAAYEGTRYVARALGMTALPGVAAGLVYALSPRMLGAVGVLSSEVLPGAVLPWAVLPLVLARAGRLSPRQAGLWAGIAVLFMGGVNAVSTLATIPLMAAVVLAGIRRPGGRSLVAWWATGTVLACAWWVPALLLLGRYSPPFLDYIETSTATTSSTTWANSLRGSEHWLAYVVVGDRPWWPGAHALATEPLLVVLGGLISAFAVFGLCHRKMPMRGPLVASTLIGLLCLTAGNDAVGGSLVDGPVRSLLDGPLAPLRNVHKVDPLLRLPMALGLAHAVALGLTRLSAGSTGLRILADKRAVSRGVPVALVMVILASGAPLFTGDLRMPGFERVPQAWTQTAEYLADEPDSRAIVLPGSGFGLQKWGWTIDEPMQGVATTSWVTRSQVPLVPGATARYLDTIERRVASGEGGAGLADLLSRGGITHVVLRRDLDPAYTETVSPDRAEVALLNTPGLERVAGFGRSGFGDQSMIDVYAVERPTEHVSLLDAGAVQNLRGAPDDVLSALEAGVLDPETSVVTGGGTSARQTIVGDGYTRVERQFGQVHDAISQVMTKAEAWRTDRREHDFPLDRSLPHVTAEYRGEVQVNASTSQGYADSLGAIDPASGPAAAFDGDPSTSWQSGSLEPPEEQWLEVDLREPVDEGVVSVQFENGVGKARVGRARVTLGTGASAVSRVFGVPVDGLLVIPPLTGPVDHIRLAVVSATGSEARFGHVAVSEISIPGVETGRTTVLPEPVSGESALSFRLVPPRRACVDIGIGPHCTPEQARPGQDSGRLDRTFTLSGQGAWRVSGSVVANPDPAAAALLAPLPNSASATADSVLRSDPSVSGRFAFDGSAGTTWLAEPTARTATLTITFPGTHRIRRIQIAPPSGDAVRPHRVVLRSRDDVRNVDLSGFGFFKPMRATKQLELTFVRTDRGEQDTRAMGASEVVLPGLDHLTSPVELGSSTGAVCGLGPELQIDGIVHRTAVSGLLGDVVRGRPLGWRVCDGPVVLGPGRHRVAVSPTVQFQPVSLGWLPVDGGTSPSSASRRSLVVRTWEPTQRTMIVGPGPAAVLRVAENPNSGWHAALEGEPLDAAAIDGWQQGYKIPDGAGGVVSLVYQPDRTFRASLLLGLVLAALLVVFAVTGQVVEVRRRRRAKAVDSCADSLEPASVPGRRMRLLVGAVLILAGGPVAGGAYVVGHASRVRRLALPLGVGLVFASSLLAAYDTAVSAGSRGPANLAAAIGGGLVFAAALHLGPDAKQVSPRSPRRLSAETLRAVLARHRVVVAGLILVVMQGLVRLDIASGSYYWQDDFLHLTLARADGLSQDFLIRDYQGHVEIGQYFLYWVLAHVIETSFLPAALTLVGFQTIASVLLLIVLLLLFGPNRPWILVPFAAYLFTPLGLAAATWWAAGMQAYPLQIALLASVLGLVQLTRTGQTRWAVVSVMATVAGLLCWEKALLILPALLGVWLLVLTAGLPMGERLRGMARLWWFWAAHLVVLVSYLVLYLSMTASQRFGSELDRGVWESLQEMVIKTLVPGLFGGPWDNTEAGNTVFTDTGPAWQALGLALLLVLVVASFVRRGRAALAGWLLLTSYLVADIALVFLGRGDYLSIVARDPRYVTDALPIIVIGVCAAFGASTLSSAGRLPRPSVGARTSRRLAATVIALITTSGLITTYELAPGAQHGASREYVTQLTSTLARDPGRQVLAWPLPAADVSVSVTMADLLLAVDREQELDRPGPTPQLVDDRGVTHAAELIDVDTSRSGPVSGCGWPLKAVPRFLTYLSATDDPKRLLRLGYLAGDDAVIHVRFTGVEQAASVRRGVGESFFVFPGGAGTVEAWATGDPNGLCVTDLQRGVPWPVE